MTSCRHLPKGFGGTRRSADDVKRDGWLEQGVLVVRADDSRLTWPEREAVHQIGSRLYGERQQTREVRHG